MRAWALLAIVIATPAMAEVVPAPSREDPRLVAARFEPDEPVRLLTAPGNDLTVILAPDERIADTSVSNSAAYQVKIADARDSFTLHSTIVLFQGAPTSDATLSVTTDKRKYQFVLTSASEVPAPYVLRFTYGRSERSRPPQDRDEAASSYKLTGNRELRPISVRDDGAKTYIRWSGDQAIPAVFALDRLGREEMVDGYMRAGVFTIDRVHDRLVFRIDDSKAEALRAAGRSRK